MAIIVLTSCCACVPAMAGDAPSTWPQWRGPTRDGLIGTGPQWPEKLTGGALKELWRVTLQPGYSGPIVSEKAVFVAETREAKTEVVRSLDRATGKELWKAEWPGSIIVPFFAWSNGSWIRSTPAYDGRSLYVAGMLDVLVCLDADTGHENWRVDFVKEFQAARPAFGFVCSPLVDGDAVYVQAGASVAAVDKNSGKVLWRALKDEGGMNGSAFSSPIISELNAVRQLVVQSRTTLAGLDPKTGSVLWSREVPAYRGMNILTPVVFDGGVFTSTYQNKSWLFKIARSNEQTVVTEAWSNKTQGYLSTPVVVDGYAYLHLQNQRFACIDLKTGERKWLSRPFGKYCSLVAHGDKILALDQRGKLLLIAANPTQFRLLDECEVSEQETWAHLSVSGDEIQIRALNEIISYRWISPGNR